MCNSYPKELFWIYREWVEGVRNTHDTGNEYWGFSSAYNYGESNGELISKVSTCISN